MTINANGWTSAGHAVNQIYDLLYMMGRDDIAVGVGGEGGILQNGSTILPNVGGYLPLIDQVIQFLFIFSLLVFHNDQTLCYVSIMTGACVVYNMVAQ